jgi:hypothetical protein
MKLPWQKERSGGTGMWLSSGWKKNIAPQRRLRGVLSELQRDDPEARRRGGAPTFTQAEFLARRPPGRR